MGQLVGYEASKKGLRARQRGAEGGLDGQIDEENFSPFYRTLSLVGAAALLPFETLHSKGAGQGYR